MKRRILVRATLAGPLFGPASSALLWAQSASETGEHRLVKAPKIALVVGNGAYKSAGALKNPLNDARDIGQALKGTGFQVTTLLDLDRDAMSLALKEHANQLKARNAVGLFYFAGHAVQLDWRNFMIPVDASLRRLEDISGECVDIGALMENLSRAANPMNIVILDACRDNPFTVSTGHVQKGLSQMDAPPNTLLAYATSPGHVASDGEGENGLYTEHLLREIQVPEAKIEDIFKRVRLGVRRKSKGAQIPWESTSLEEDFWFLPPAQRVVASALEQERRFEEELQFWEKVASSTSPAPLEDYLRRWPSGRFTELAQLALDKVLAAQGEKRIIIAPAPGNPYAAGSVRADLGFKVGDTYIRRVTDLQTGVVNPPFTAKVAEVRDDQVVFENGSILDRLGNQIRTPQGIQHTPRQDQPLEYAVGHKWSTRFKSRNEQRGGSMSLEFFFQITGKQRITVPAGTFDCFVIEGVAPGLTDSGRHVQMRLKRWMAPAQVRLPIVAEVERRRMPPDYRPDKAAQVWKRPSGSSGAPPGRVFEATRTELISYRQG